MASKLFSGESPNTHCWTTFKIGKSSLFPVRFRTCNKLAYCAEICINAALTLWRISLRMYKNIFAANSPESGEYKANGLTNAIRHQSQQSQNDRQTFVGVRKHSRSFTANSSKNIRLSRRNTETARPYKWLRIPANFLRSLRLLNNQCGEFLDGNVLAVKGTASVWHIPASQEHFSDCFSLIFGHRCRNSVIKEHINDGLAHFRQKQTDAVVSDMEAVSKVNV